MASPAACSATLGKAPVAPLFLSEGCRCLRGLGGHWETVASAHRSELLCRGTSLPLSLACVERFFLAQQMLYLSSAKLGMHLLRLLGMMPQCPPLL